MKTYRKCTNFWIFYGKSTFKIIQHISSQKYFHEVESFLFPSYSKCKKTVLEEKPSLSGTDSRVDAFLNITVVTSSLGSIALYPPYLNFQSHSLWFISHISLIVSSLTLESCIGWILVETKQMFIQRGIFKNNSDKENATKATQCWMRSVRLFLEKHEAPKIYI